MHDHALTRVATCACSRPQQCMAEAVVYALWPPGCEQADHVTYFVDNMPSSMHMTHACRPLSSEWKIYACTQRTSAWTSDSGNPASQGSLYTPILN